ncbi:MAG: hypothetical protein NZ556_00285 [Fimbriimonadales bacterium]|nr:hypothetical protein [Fimbriimonadales bacterium]
MDLNRAARALALQAQVETPSARLPAAQATQPAGAIALAQVEPPPPAETVSRRRQVALSSIQQQRDAVRQQLLQTRLQPLPELEQRWRAEFRAEYDFETLRANQDAEWQEAFQAYGRQRFPLLVALIFASPDSDAYRQTQAQLKAVERAFQEQERAIEARYQAQRARIEQEIEVRVNARRREFIRDAEQEIQAQLAQQPDPAELYLPQPSSLPPAAARKEPAPPLRVQLPERPLNTAQLARRAEAERLRRELLRQLAQEWAETQGYRLTDNPNAPDKTDAFIRYLLAR